MCIVSGPDVLTGPVVTGLRATKVTMTRITLEWDVSPNDNCLEITLNPSPTYIVL